MTGHKTVHNYSTGQFW